MPSSQQIAEYLRVVAYGIAFFDYLQTLPAEWRLYSRQKGISQLSAACILFILVRYIGLIAIIIGNTGFFYHGFSKEACHRFYWLAPIFKLILYTVSQGILAIRTYAVSRKSPVVLRILVVLFVLCAVPELISVFWKRVSFQTNFNCTSGNLPGIKIASLFNVGALVFDLVTMVITSVYLWKFSNSSRTSFSQLTRMMLHDGLMYFIALTAMNAVNIIFFQNNDEVLQPSATTLGYAATMIFSGRFILNLSELVREDVSGHRIQSSGTPRHDGTGFRGPADRPDMVVTVVKNVGVGERAMGRRAWKYGVGDRFPDKSRQELLSRTHAPLYMYINQAVDMLFALHPSLGMSLELGT
ncbi:hypothetical protein DFH06DRAFT_1291529 [Mycena polygramma]|nr:hypothetical protein DFH06DRAFT_1291529 [Mycena polygramma]